MSRLVTIAFWTIMLGLFFVLFFSSENSDYIRYDKYQLYLGWPRAMVAAAALFAALRLLRDRCCLLDLSVLLPMNVFLVLFLVLVLPGVLLTADFSPAGATAFYGYLTAFVVFSCAAWLVSLLLRFQPRTEIRDFYSKQVSVYEPGSPTYTIVVLMSLAALAIAVATTHWQQSIFSVIFEFLMTGAMPEAAKGIAEQRQDIYLTDTYIGTTAIIASYATTMLLPLASMFFLINGRLRQCRSELAIGLLVAIITFLILVYSGSRLRGLSFLLFVLVTISFMRKFNTRTIMQWAGGILALLVLQTIALGRMSGGDNYIANVVMALNRVAERILLTKGYVTGQVFHYIPDASPFRYGETMLNSIVGHATSQVPFSEEMNEVILGYAGTAGPQAFAEAYANFGVPGMLLIAAALGALVQVVTILIVRRAKRDPWNLAFLGFVALLIGRVGYGDVFTFKSYGLHLLFVLWIAIRVATSILEGALSNQRESVNSSAAGRV